MCMNGGSPAWQACLVTLDLLWHLGLLVYYAGDLDPELLSDRTKNFEILCRSIYYWHMALEDYEKSKSNEIISEKRIQKSLERITDVELFPVIEKMRIDRLAGYQEKIEYESCSLSELI